MQVLLVNRVCQVLEYRLTRELVWLQDINTIVTYVITLDSPVISLVVSSLNLLKIVWPVHSNWAPIHINFQSW